MHVLVGLGSRPSWSTNVTVHEAPIDGGTLVAGFEDPVDGGTLVVAGFAGPVELTRRCRRLCDRSSPSYRPPPPCSSSSAPPLT